MEQLLYQGAVFDIRIPIAERQHYVYALLDDQGNAFYVGYSTHPIARSMQHSGDNENRNSYNAIRANKRPRMVILSIHKNREEALQKEHSYITRHPHLVNARGYLKGAKRGPCPHKTQAGTHRSRPNAKDN